MFDEKRVKYLDQITRFVIFICILICIVAPFVSNIKYSIDEKIKVIPLLVSTFFIALTLFYYNFFRSEKRIVDGLQALIEMLVYSTVLGIISYIAAYTGLELKTDVVSGIDKLIGFNWKIVHEFVEKNYFLKVVLFIAYNSLLVQFIVVLIVFSLFGDRNWLRVFINSFTLLGFLTILISVFVPTIEVDIFWNVAQAIHTGSQWVVENGKSLNGLPAEHFLNLHGGFLSTLPLSNLQGIISFPSYHTALGIIFIICFSSVKKLFLPIFVLNVLLIVSTPPIGVHYFADIIGGLLVGILGMAAILKFVMPKTYLLSVFTRQEDYKGELSQI